MMDAILLVGPQGPAWKRIRSHLVKQGFRVTAVEAGELDGLEENSKDRFLLGLLDAGNEGRLSDLLDRVRRPEALQQLPWIALVKASQVKELAGLAGPRSPFSGGESRAGLEDFLVTPAEPETVEARIRFVLRRLNHLAPGSGIRIGALELNVDRYEVTLDGEPLELTYKEFELFKFLATHPGRVFSRDQLLNQVWSYNFIGGTRTVDVHIRRLRAKLGPKYASLIATLRNVGYKFLESL